MSGHIGCFLYAKLIRDIICLLAGGGLIYSIVRWRHFVLFPFVCPFAKVVTFQRYNGNIAREFEVRKWASTFGQINGCSLSLYLLVMLVCGRSLSGYIIFMWCVN